MEGHPIGHRCAFAVITVVPEAHELFKAAVGRPAVVVEDGYPWTVVELPAQGGGTHLVVEGQAPDRSNQPAQAFAARMLRVWRPHNLIVADIGGGIFGGGEQARDGLALGDVVVATELHYPEYAKLVPAERGRSHGTRAPRHIRTQPISYRLSTLARQLDEVVPDWPRSITTPRPVADGAARLLPGEIVVGEKLLSDPDAAEVAYIVHTFDKALAVDMESIGVAVAALSAADDGLPVRFLVLRGISDWIDTAGNQETRDNWKPYAADTAVAAALGVIAATPAAFTPTERAEMESASELRRRISDQYPVPDTTYPNVVSGPEGTLLRGDVLATAAQRHGVVLVGEGGVGKTALIVQATVAAAAPLDPFPVLVDLKTWKPEFAEGLSRNPSGADLRPSMDALLRASVQRIGVDLLETIVTRRDVLVIVDGLNEVPYGEVGSRILTLLDEYMRAHPNARVLVTDRRVSDFYRERNWVTLRLERLATADVQEIVDDRFTAGTFRGLASATQSLLRVPYFLDRALRAGQLAVASRSGAMESFLREHGGLTDEQIDELASIAFNVYEQRHSRTFPAAAVVENGLSAELVARLRDAGILTTAGGDELRFDHQLEHDYLAGRHLAADAGRWTADVFDAVTFEASSFDALGLALEHVDLQDRDAFVRQVYDWNWRGAISAIADVEQEGEAACSAELRMALLAVTAEKRFDPVSGTRERTNRQLGRFDDAYAQALVTASSLDALTEVVASLPEREIAWFERWRTVFCRMPPTPLTAEEVLWLAEDDSVIGWTAANTVRRFPFDAERAEQLRELYIAQPEPSQAARATRWRVVHALGAWPDPASATLLLDAVDHDEHDWVKYGAVRSLMEMAARTSDVGLRTIILDGLRARIGHIPREPLSQLAWAARYAGADAGFAAAVRPLLHAALDAQGTETDRERWQVRIQQFEAYWSVAAPTAAS